MLSSVSTPRLFTSLLCSSIVLSPHFDSARRLPSSAIALHRYHPAVRRRRCTRRSRSNSSSAANLTFLYEPLIATVTVTNNAGRRHHARKTRTASNGSTSRVNHVGGSMIPPLRTRLQTPSAHGAGGDSRLQRQIDLTPLFPDPRAGDPPRPGRTFISRRLDKLFLLQLRDVRPHGRQAAVAAESVGVPGFRATMSGRSRLLTHQLPDRLLLYVRVRDENGTDVYTTQVSRTADHDRARAAGDFSTAHNTLHVMHEAIPGTYLYTQISVNGERGWTKRFTCARGTSRSDAGQDPRAARSGVRGGQIQTAPAVGAGPAKRDSVPKLSDRPAGDAGADQAGDVGADRR